MRRLEELLVSSADDGSWPARARRFARRVRDVAADTFAPPMGGRMSGPHPPEHG
jgi:hypothetical protein